jgi:hypothetical protein
MMKYINDDPMIRDFFPVMKRRLEDEIATLEDRVAQFSLAKATFEQVVEFSKSLLVDISAAWEIADLDQKQRVQNALFLGGLKYHPKNGILNPDNASLFCQLDNFLGGKMDLVALPGIVLRLRVS